MRTSNALIALIIFTGCPSATPSDGRFTDGKDPSTTVIAAPGEDDPVVVGQARSGFGYWAMTVIDDRVYLAGAESTKLPPEIFELNVASGDRKRVFIGGDRRDSIYSMVGHDKTLFVDATAGFFAVETKSGERTKVAPQGGRILLWAGEKGAVMVDESTPGLWRFLEIAPDGATKIASEMKRPAERAGLVTTHERYAFIQSSAGVMMVRPDLTTVDIDGPARGTPCGELDGEFYLMTSTGVASIDTRTGEFEMRSAGEHTTPSCAGVVNRKVVWTDVTYDGGSCDKSTARVMAFDVDSGEVAELATTLYNGCLKFPREVDDGVVLFDTNTAQIVYVPVNP